MISWGKKIPMSLLTCIVALGAPCLARADDAPAAAGAAGQPAGTANSGTTASPGDGAAAGTAAAPAEDSDKARDALKQKGSDATSEKNLQQVFQAAEKTYSLLKAGGVALTYGVNYSYFRNSVIDIAISSNSSSLTRFRIEDDAQHTVTNDISLDYGVWNNLTFNFDAPFISKLDTNSGIKASGLGDISFGVRWQPFPLKNGLPTTTLFGSLSTATGASPYDIDLNNNLAMGKGFYSLSGGVSVSKVIDPVVLFASGSYGYGLPLTDVDQLRGSRILTRVDPGDSIGLSFGMAYSLNYDVSVSGSVQVSAGLPTKFTFQDGSIVNSADQVTSVFNMGLSLRTSPKRIVNLTFGFGLTPDSPNLILGFNLPVDIAGFTTTGQ
jgi:hypothetical protein